MTCAQSPAKGQNGLIREEAVTMPSIAPRLAHRHDRGLPLMSFSGQCVLAYSPSATMQ